MFEDALVLLMVIFVLLFFFSDIPNAIAYRIRYGKKRKEGEEE